MPYNFSSNLQANLGQQAVFGAIIVIWPDQADLSAMTPVQASDTLTTQVPVVIQNNFSPSIIQAPPPPTTFAGTASTLSIGNLGIEVSGEDIPSSIDLSEL